MERVAFWFDAPIEYTGGVNYIKNLLYAASLVSNGSLQFYVFLPADAPEPVAADFAPYATVVRTRLLQRWTWPWFIHRVIFRALGSMVIATGLLKRYGITMISHAWFVYNRAPFPVASWIPDFQYLHLPELFPRLDGAKETRHLRRMIARSDLVVLSSQDALEDFERISPPECMSRGRILRFVSQPRATRSGQGIRREQLEEKYGFEGRYFFLPNQFWVHKNHTAVLRAVKILKDRGVDVQVLCTGNTVDYRQKKGNRHIDDIAAYIDANGLHDHVRILGLISYDDVLSLMRHSVAVVNPSRFEGWSSSVEEARSMGKPIVLSRIKVHLEQDPPGATYFDPDDADDLARALACVWATPVDEPARVTEERALEDLRERTLTYGREYCELLAELRMKGQSRIARTLPGS